MHTLFPWTLENPLGHGTLKIGTHFASFRCLILQNETRRMTAKYKG